MNTLSQAELKTLLERNTGISISLFMPTHRAGAGARQDPIRFRNLLFQAEAQLSENGFGAHDAQLFLASARLLADDSYFWRHQSDGLAVFLVPSQLRHYALPHAFEEQVVLAPHFHIRPLLPVLESADQFYILALCQDTARLFRSTGHHLDQVEAGLPPSRAEALQTVPSGKQFAPRSVGATPVGGGRAPAMFYSGSSVNTKEMIAHYFRQVDEAVREFLRDDKTPVILAGVEYLHPLYRGVSRMVSLASEGIFGNLEGMEVKTIQRLAREIGQAQRQKKREAAIGAYRKIANTQRAAHDISTIVCAAYQRRVDTLFVDTHSQQWGRFDPITSSVEVRFASRNRGDEDLLNLAAIHTVLNGGIVHAVDPTAMPDIALAAAILRSEAAPV